jgi:large subunit ribosomal protein L30
MSFVVVRVRGTIHARHDIVETLHHLHLSRPNHATVLPETPTVRGMLTKVQGYVTWGEADVPTVGELLAARGATTEGKKVAPGPDLTALAKSVADQGLIAVDQLKPLFRLRAPKGGWRSTKKPFTRGGALGYRGRSINDLVRRML